MTLVLFVLERFGYFYLPPFMHRSGFCSWVLLRSDAELIDSIQSESSRLVKDPEGVLKVMLVTAKPLIITRAK